MPTQLNVIKRRVSHVLNALKADDFDVAVKNYVPGPAEDNYNSPMFPPMAIDDAIIDAQGDLIMVICDTAGHPWRQWFKSRTAPVAHGAVLPLADYKAVPVIGPWGVVRDAQSGEALLPSTINRIRRTRRGSYHLLPYYYFAIQDGTIYHTRDAAIVECCAYDRRTVSNDCSSLAGAIAVPDVLADAIVCKAIHSLAMKEELYPAMVQGCYQFFSDTVASIRQGLITIESKAQLPPLPVAA